MILLFSWILEFISVVKAVEKKIQDEKTKRIKRRTKDEALKESDSIAEAHEKTKNSDNVVEAEKKSKKLKGQKILIDVLKFVAELFEVSIIGTLIFIGILIFFVALVVILIMFILYGFLTNTGIIPDGGIFSPSQEDCIQGTQALSQNNFQVPNQLSGTLTEQQKNIAASFGLVNDIIGGKYGDISDILVDQYSKVDSGQFIKDSEKYLSRNEIIALLTGVMSAENSFEFPGTSDIMTIPCNTTKDENNDAWLGLEADQGTFIGKYQYTYTSDTMQLYSQDFVDAYTAVYKYDSKTDNSGNNPHKSLNNFVPYGIATEIGFLGYCYGERQEAMQIIDDKLPAMAAEFGITHNVDKLNYMFKYFILLARYHGHYNSDTDNLMRFWLALWAASSENDADRSFLNYELKAGYGESDYRPAVLGSPRSAKGYNINGDVGKYGIVFALNGQDINIPLVRFAKDYCDSKGIDYSDVISFLNEKNGRSWQITNVHYPFIAYLSGMKAMNDIGIATPIVTGGSIDDCDCYEGGSGGSVGSLSDIDLSNVQVGVAQGPWNADLMAKINNRKSNEGFGYFKDHFGKTFENSSRKDKEEEWRKNSKWKVPYYNQSSSANVVFWSNNLNYHSSTGGGDLDACGTYMLAYMLSAATGRLINPVEAFAVGLELDIFAANGHMQYNNNNFAKLNEYGIYITHIEGGNNSANKAKIDECLEKGGIVGVRSTNPRNKFVNSAHFFVITEKVGDKYNVYASTGFDRDTKQSYTWDVVTLGLARFFLMDNINRASEGGSNQQVGGNTQGTVSTTTSFENFLFIGDSFTVQLNSNLSSEMSKHQVRAAGGAYPDQYVKDSDADGKIDFLTTSITVGTGKLKETVDPLPDGVNGVVVLIGTNQVTRSDQVEDTKVLLQTLVDKYDVPIYVQKVFPKGYYKDPVNYHRNNGNYQWNADDENAATDTFNQEIANFCSTNPELIFIDTTAGLVENGYLKYTGDGLHLYTTEKTDDGRTTFEVWYENIKNAILNGGSTSTNSSSVNCISTGSNSGVSSAGAIDLDLGVDDYTEKIKAGSWGHSYTKTRTKDEIKFIVVHFWGSQSKNSGDAQGLIHGYETGGMNREDGKTYMAQYVVDKDGIYRTAPDLVNVQHSGGGLDKTKGSGYVYNNALKPLGMERCTSNNSIGIEASNSDLNNTAATDNPNANVTKGFYVYEKGTIENLISLTKALMIEYNIDVDHIYRHYDCTMKTCPAPFIDDQYLWPSSASEYDKGESQNWKAFKECLTSDTIDWSKFNDHVVDNIK